MKLVDSIVKLQSVPSFEEIRKLFDSKIKPIFQCEEWHLFIKNASGNFDLWEHDTVTEIITNEWPVFWQLIKDRLTTKVDWKKVK